MEQPLDENTMQRCADRLDSIYNMLIVLHEAIEHRVYGDEHNMQPILSVVHLSGNMVRETRDDLLDAITA